MRISSRKKSSFNGRVQAAAAVEERIADLSVGHRRLEEIRPVLQQLVDREHESLLVLLEH